MSETPERIWVDPEGTISRVQIVSEDVEYIRADVVKELLDDMQAECESAIERMGMEDE